MSLLRCCVVVSLMVVLAASCGGAEEAAEEPTPAPTSTETVGEEPTASPTESPSPRPTATPQVAEPAVPSPPPSTGDEATPVPTSGSRVVLPVTGWEAVGNGTNMWAGELLALDTEFFVAGNEAGPQVPVPRSGVWRSTDGVTWVDSLIFPASPTGSRTDLADMTLAGSNIVGLAQRTDGTPWPQASGKELVALSSDDRGRSWSESVVHTWGAVNFRELMPPTFAHGDPDLVFAVEGGAGESGGDDTITGTLVWLRTGDGWDFIDPAESGLARVWVWAMAATEDGFVALGDTREAVEGFADCQTQALWTSPDARSWTKVWTNDRDCEWFGVHELLTLDGDLLAVANENDVITCGLNDDDEYECPPLNAPVRVFRIRDQAVENIAVSPDAFTDMLVTDVDLNDDGVIVATGRTFDNTEARIWLSTDARTWTHADIPAADLVEKELFQVTTNTNATTIILGNQNTPTGPTNFHTWVNISP